VKEKEIWVAYLLWFLLGFLGVHKFYLGKIGWGILYIFTGGLFLVGLLIDLFTLPSQVRRANEELRSFAGSASRQLA
jgi:TM2 domain-containing membrane protein YozV